MKEKMQNIDESKEEIAKLLIWRKGMRKNVPGVLRQLSLAFLTL